MDAGRFDALTRAAAHSRRTVLGTALGALAASLFGARADAAQVKRGNGAICSKNGDCRSSYCAAKDATGRRHCQCATECLLLDGSPGDCSSGVCTCPICPSPECACLANNQGRLGCGIFFVETAGIQSAATDDPFAGYQRVTSLSGAAHAAASVCAVDADCPPAPDVLSCYPFHPFCIGGQYCALFLDCKDDGPAHPC